jgi:hypothetical protein
MTSSSGLFSQLCLGVTTKGQVFERMNNGKYTLRNTKGAACVKTLYDDCVQKLMRGKRPIHIGVTCHKKELLAKEKINKGRTFDYFDVSFTMAERKLMGLFYGSLSTPDPDHPVAVGMDGVHDFNKRFSKHAKFPRHGSVDFKKYDKMFAKQVVNILISAFRKIFEMTDDPIIKQWVVSSVALIRTLFSSNRLIGNAIWEVLYSMPSGSAGTAPLNSLLNLIINYYAFCVLVGPTPWKKFLELTKMSFYGDDCFISFKEELLSVYDMEKVAKVILDHFGMKVDSDKKDGKIVASTGNMEELSFLSRTPRFLSGIGWVGALRKESILGPLFFARRNQTTPAAFFRELERASEEAARHGPEFYAKFLTLYNEVSKVSRDSGRNTPIAFPDQMANLIHLNLFDSRLRVENGN